MRVAREYGIGRWRTVLNATRWRRDFSFGNRLCRRIPWNFAKRYFAKWYLRAPLIHVNRGSSRFRSLFKLNYDKIIRALDIFAMPDFAALRTPAIQIDGNSCAIPDDRNLRPALRGKRQIL